MNQEDINDVMYKSLPEWKKSQLVSPDKYKLIVKKWGVSVYGRDGGIVCLIDNDSRAVKDSEYHNALEYAKGVLLKD